MAAEEVVVLKDRPSTSDILKSALDQRIKELAGREKGNYDYLNLRQSIDDYIKAVTLDEKAVRIIKKNNSPEKEENYTNEC